MKPPIQNRRKYHFIATAALCLSLCCFQSAWGLAKQSKFGPYAIPITQQTTFLRQTPAPDYWSSSQFYIPQQTSSACGLASTTMALNFLLGVPKYANQTLITQPALLETVFTGDWANRVAEGGDGLKFDELVTLVNAGLDSYKLKRYTLEVIRPANNSEGLELLKRVLSENERSANDLVLAYFNQGVLTSDWDGPHISPIGAYDPNSQQVLIMDVDREWYPPYWSPVDKLLEALLRPAPDDQGILAGEIGGLLWFKLKR
ncbi:MAG: phytochelatin synthase family protein [Methylococcales bacterium]